ncbi:MAG: hypothetical protein WCH75_28690, partial [Candidatus Binatia bacterium]
ARTSPISTASSTKIANSTGHAPTPRQGSETPCAGCTPRPTHLAYHTAVSTRREGTPILDGC